MALVTLEQAKQHLRVDGSDEDETIQAELDAAEEQAIAYLGRSIYIDQGALDAAVAADTAGDRPMVVNASVVAAIKLILGHLYRNRDDVTSQQFQLPGGSRELLTPFRIGWGP